MARYIDADLLKHRIEYYHSHTFEGEDLHAAYGIVLKEIENQPIVAAQKAIELTFDFNITGGPHQDLYEWNVAFEGECTVKDFLHYIFEKRKDEYGEIAVNSNALSKKKTKVCEYKHGKVYNLNEQLFNAIAHKTVREISAFGGYTNMNYLIRTEDVELIQAWEQIEKLEHDLTIANEKVRGLTDIAQEKDVEIKSLKDKDHLLEQQIAVMKKASLWQRIRGWK